MTEEIESLSQFVSHIKKPIWIRGKEDFYAKCVIREFLQKCSSEKIIEMLKSILSVEERMGLVKTELDSFFQNQTKSFENHMMVKNELNETDDQFQTRIKTEPKDVDFIEKPKELKTTFYKCVLCSNKYETSQDIESHLTNVHSVSIHCQNLFIEKENSSKLTENIDENFVSTNANSVLEPQTELSHELSQSMNEQQIEEKESNEENIQNGDQDSVFSDSIIQSVIEMEIPRLSDSMEDIPDLSNNTSDGRSENLEGHEIIEDKNTEENIEIEKSNENLSLPKKVIKIQSNKSTIRAIDEKTNIAEDSKHEDLNISSAEDTGSYKEYLLPYDWKKVALKRRNSDRWDFHVLSPQGKKLRSNIEIKKYLEVNPDIKCDRSVTNTSKKMVQIDSVSEISGDKGIEENKDIGDSEAKSNEKLTLPKTATKPQKALEKQQETQDSETTSNEKLPLPKIATEEKQVTEKKLEARDFFPTSFYLVA